MTDAPPSQAKPSKAPKASNQSNESTRPVQRVVVGEDLVQPELLDFAGGHAAIYSSSAPDKGSGNEDAVGVFASQDRDDARSRKRR